MTDWNVISVVSWLDDMVTVPNIVVVQFPCKPSGKVQLWLSEKGSNYGDRDLDKLNSFQRLCDQSCILKFWTICVSETLHFNVENWSCPLFNDSPTRKDLTPRWKLINYRHNLDYLPLPLHYRLFCAEYAGYQTTKGRSCLNVKNSSQYLTHQAYAIQMKY